MLEELPHHCRCRREVPVAVVAYGDYLHHRNILLADQAGFDGEVGLPLHFDRLPVCQFYAEQIVF